MLGHKVFEYGAESKERSIQKEREQGVLQALFFSKLPDNPQEPDFMSEEHEESKTIPLDDVSNFSLRYNTFHTKAFFHFEIEGTFLKGVARVCRSGYCSAVVILDCLSGVRSN